MSIFEKKQNASTSSQMNHKLSVNRFKEYKTGSFVQQKKIDFFRSSLIKENQAMNLDIPMVINESKKNLMHNSLRSSYNSSKSNADNCRANEIVQRVVDVYTRNEEYDDNKALKYVEIYANGKVKDFKGGSKAQNCGWNGVKYYYPEAKVESERVSPTNWMRNSYKYGGHAGHLLAKQFGGKGDDPDNIFAQNAGGNTSSYISEFESDFKELLSKSDDKAKVNFVVSLRGKNIEQGPIKRKRKGIFSEKKKKPKSRIPSDSESESESDSD